MVHRPGGEAAEALARVLRVRAAELPDQRPGARHLHVQVRIAVAQRVGVVRRIVVDRIGVPGVRVVDGVHVGDDGLHRPVVGALDQRAGRIDSR